MQRTQNSGINFSLQTRPFSKRDSEASCLVSDLSNCFCKVTVLVPFYFTVTSTSKVEVTNSNVSSNILCLIWSLVFFVIILAGFMYYVIFLFSVSTNSREEITSFLVSMPLSISLALMEIFMNQSVNR